jgi:hypothetical protein
MTGDAAGDGGPSLHNGADESLSSDSERQPGATHSVDSGSDDLASDVDGGLGGCCSVMGGDGTGGRRFAAAIAAVEVTPLVASTLSYPLPAPPDPTLTNETSAPLLPFNEGLSSPPPPEPPLELEEFLWAWMMVRSRAITFRVRRASDGHVEARRCMVPVVDLMVRFEAQVAKCRVQGLGCRV